MQPTRATIRKATFDEAEAAGMDGTLRRHGPTYIIETAEGARFACAADRTRLLEPAERQVRQ